MKRLIVAMLLCATACSPSTPVSAASASPTPVPLRGDSTATPIPSFPVAPAATCRVLPRPDYLNQEPSHAPVNGQPSLGVPTLRGVILIQIRQCRDIGTILQKYGLPGPATRYIDVLESDEMIANGATRWYRVAVPPGTESATVVELYQHPEDIEYVQLLPEFVGGAASG
jgi:hypothetical protein